MEDDLPEEFRVRKTLMIEEVDRAFRGVSRVGGISWRETAVVEWSGSDEERAQARAEDAESRWRDLVDDASWTPWYAQGWSFLDPIGFRYYLPVAMVRSLQSGHDEGIVFWLTLPSGLPKAPSFREHALKRWSALNAEQRVCVRHFLESMLALAELQPSQYRSIEAEPWQKALASHWAEA